MPKGKGGRRPRRGTPMPHTSITAFPHEMAFLLLMGEGSVATGVQRLVAHVAKSNNDMEALMRRAERLVAEAERHVEPDENGHIQQRFTYQYMRDHYWELYEETIS